jgi:hypothetical protein
VPQTIVPMIHVPDVRTTAEWYTSIAFKVRATNEEDGEMNWAAITYGDSEFMLNIGGKPSTAHRREVDLYVREPNVDQLYGQLKDRVHVVEGPHDTFYGMREFIIRDCNGFWITFGQPMET